MMTREESLILVTKRMTQFKIRLKMIIIEEEMHKMLDTSPDIVMDYIFDSLIMLGSTITRMKKEVK